ncbi:putative fructokinase-6 [Cucumis melo var. makuwa]|uniref:Fructokinase-6 n=1 Tax=Cucumis melo var. makuwa TaxID=1194695 RepID=A0A5A7UN76_CUCMM|nr:putative fructokinase-6 [Cucumis melo var. makuwa]TYK01513.1 putative fructokinase-6 [Cucumis melo var. makuwa]
MALYSGAFCFHGVPTVTLESLRHKEWAVKSYGLSRSRVVSKSQLKVKGKADDPRMMAGGRGGIPAAGDNREQEEVEEIATLSPRTSMVRLLAVEDSLGDLHEKFDRVMDSLETLT